MLQELEAAYAQLEVQLAENQRLHAELLSRARASGIQDERQRWRARSTTRWRRVSPGSSRSYWPRRR